MNHHLNIQRYILPLALILGLLAAGSAHAAVCTITAPTMNFQVGNSTIRNDTAVGQFISSPQTMSFTLNCPASSSPNGYNGVIYSYLSPTTTVMNAAATGVSGIGIVIINQTSNRVMSQAPQSGEAAFDNPFTQGVHTYTLSYRLVRIPGNLTSGKNQLMNIPLFNIYSMDMGNYDRGAPVTAYLNGSVDVITPSCTVMNSPLTVTLPTVSASQFKSSGDTGGGKNFQIDLRCTAGNNVYITFTDANNSGNTSQTLTTQTGGATGIGLQILHNGKAVSFDPGLSAVDNANQWPVGPSDGLTSIPLTVQYISTAATVSPGAVNAAATFTFSYQ